MNPADEQRARALNLPQCVDAARAGCGEGPLWDTGRQCLWWVDIAGQTLHRYDPKRDVSGHRPMPCLISGLALREDRRLLVASADGIAVFDEPSGRLDTVHDPEPDTPGNRLNDMVVAADGSLWAGTMAEGASGATGALYRYGPDGVQTMMHGTTISNGLDTSPDGSRLYFVDSVPGRLHVHEDDAWRVMFEFDDSTGKPDGLTVDADGTLWIALCDRGQVIGMTPEARIVDRIELPCDIVTSCAFGGADLRTLFITTGTFSMSERQKLANPLAGGLFALPMAVPGRAPHEAKWPQA